jgi:hypothetical protein
MNFSELETRSHEYKCKIQKRTEVINIVFTTIAGLMASLCVIALAYVGGN